MAAGSVSEAADKLEAHLKNNRADSITFDLLSQCLARTSAWDRLLRVHADWQKNNPSLPYMGLTAYVREADALINTASPQKALALLESVSSRFSDMPAYWSAMGHVCRANHLHDREFDFYKKAYDQAPDNPRNISNFGLALANQGKLAEAIALFDKALSAHPLLANVYVNRAYAHKKKHDLPKAIADLKRALEITPLAAAAHYALGCAYIQNEDYECGWPHYEWNWHVSSMPKFRPTTDIPNWYGEDLTDKKLLVFVEQGIGDTLMCARYLPLLENRYKNIKISVICEKKLKTLLETSFPFLHSILIKEDLKNDDKIEADYMVAFGSLPSVFKTTIADVPAQVPYIKARSPKNYKDAQTRFVIGITWSSQSLDAGHKRSLPLSDLSFLKDVPGIKIIDLQYGDTVAEREENAKNGFSVLHDDSVDPYTDIEAHVSQIAACDLIISVDNTTVHAAGALGKPVWTLLPYDAYWRWHLGHLSTPWYPTMRLFRQGPERNFKSVLKAIEAGIKAVITGDESQLRPAVFQTRSKPQPRPPKSVLLLNDTSATYHWGCTATSEALQNEIKNKGYHLETSSYLELNGITVAPKTLGDFDSRLFASTMRFSDPTLISAIERADTVVINGEGTIHGTNPNALKLLYLAYAAKTFFGKKVHIINHACFPEDSVQLTNPSVLAYYLKGYRAADYVAVRDPISHKILESVGIKNTLAFDSLPLTAKKWASQTTRPERRKRIILAGSSNFSAQSANAYRAVLEDFKSEGYATDILIGAKIAKASEDKDFCDFIAGMAPGITITEASSMDEWFTHLASAALLVSGRFHYSIAAACLGTPFVAFEGNTPKLHALCEILGTKPPLSYTDPELTMKLRVATTKALRATPPSEKEIHEQTEKLCALALKNFEGL